MNTFPKYPKLEPKRVFFTDQVLTRKISGTPKYFKILKRLLQTSGLKPLSLDLIQLFQTFISTSLVTEDFILFLKDFNFFAKDKYHVNLKDSILNEACLCFRLLVFKSGNG
jgi:hypothetical protein